MSKRNNIITEISDPVLQPSHYTTGGIEVIEYIRAKITPEQFVGYCLGNTLKYVSRAGHKGDALQDYRKARVYLDWAIELLEEEDKND